MLCGRGAALLTGLPGETGSPETHPAHGTKRERKEKGNKLEVEQSGTSNIGDNSKNVSIKQVTTFLYLSTYSTSEKWTQGVLYI